MAEEEEFTGIDVFAIVGNIENVWFWKAMELAFAYKVLIKRTRKRKVPRGWPEDDIAGFRTGAQFVALMVLTMCIETALKALCVALGHTPADRKSFKWPWPRGDGAHDLTVIVNWFAEKHATLFDFNVPNADQLYRLSQYVELGRYPAQFRAELFAKANTWYEEEDGVVREVLSSAPKRFSDEEVRILASFATDCIRLIVQKFGEKSRDKRAKGAS